MTMADLERHALDLSFDERWALAEHLWNSVRQEVSAGPLTAEQQALVRARQVEAAGDPTAWQPAEEVLTELGAELRALHRK